MTQISIDEDDLIRLLRDIGQLTRQITTLIDKARARCENCGYVDFYLELKEKETKSSE